jgi:hypothetical protein
MNISFSISIAMLVVCLVAGGLGAFARWVGQQAKWPDWLSFWFGLFIALAIFSAFRAG